MSASHGAAGCHAASCARSPAGFGCGSQVSTEVLRVTPSHGCQASSECVRTRKRLHTETLGGHVVIMVCANVRTSAAAATTNAQLPEAILYQPAQRLASSRVHCKPRPALPSDLRLTGTHCGPWRAASVSLPCWGGTHGDKAVLYWCEENEAAKITHARADKYPRTALTDECCVRLASAVATNVKQRRPRRGSLHSVLECLRTVGLNRCTGALSRRRQHPLNSHVLGGHVSILVPARS